MDFSIPLPDVSEAHVNASTPVKKENNAGVVNRTYRMPIAQSSELQLPARWEGFRPSQKDCSDETPYLDLNYDGKRLSVSEIVEVKRREGDVTLFSAFIVGLSLKEEPTEYKTRASYDARLTWECDGSLMWQSPHGSYEGGKVWKLDRSRSNTDILRWICEDGEQGKLQEVPVFFWRRIPDVPAHDVHQHGNDVLWWHGIHKMLREILIQQSGCDENKVFKNSDSFAAFDVAGFSLINGELLDLLGKSIDGVNAGIDVMKRGVSPHSHSALSNVLAKSRDRVKAGIDMMKLDLLFLESSALLNLLGD